LTAIRRFVWFELNTPNPSADVPFYLHTLGEAWGVRETTSRGAPYAMLTFRGVPVAGVILPRHGALAAQWAGFFSVPDVDAAAGLAESLGGQVLAPPDELDDIGRAALVADPDGGLCYLYQSHTGAGANPGFSWNELWARDIALTIPFYCGVLGLAQDFYPGAQAGYWLWKDGEALVAGGFSYAGRTAEARWVPYLVTDDVDAAVTRATSLRGVVVQPATDVPGIGRVAHLRDPAGAAFAVVTPAAR
jgi:hypothetical protein